MPYKIIEEISYPRRAVRSARVTKTKPVNYRAKTRRKSPHQGNVFDHPTSRRRDNIQYVPKSYLKDRYIDNDEVEYVVRRNRNHNRDNSEWRHQRNYRNSNNQMLYDEDNRDNRVYRESSKKEEFDRERRLPSPTRHAFHKSEKKNKFLNLPSIPMDTFDHRKKIVKVYSPGTFQSNNEAKQLSPGESNHSFEERYQEKNLYSEISDNKDFNSSALPLDVKPSLYASSPRTMDNSLNSMFDSKSINTSSDSYMERIPTHNINNNEERNRISNQMYESNPQQPNKRSQHTNATGKSFTTKKDYSTNTDAPVKNNANVHTGSDTSMESTSESTSSSSVGRITGPIKDAYALPIMVSENVTKDGKDTKPVAVTADTPVSVTQWMKEQSSTEFEEEKINFASNKDKTTRELLDALLEDDSTSEKISSSTKNQPVVLEIVTKKLSTVPTEHDETDNWEDQDPNIAAEYLRKRRPTLKEWMDDAPNVRRRQSMAVSVDQKKFSLDDDQRNLNKAREPQNGITSDADKKSESEDSSQIGINDSNEKQRSRIVSFEGDHLADDNKNLEEKKNDNKDKTNSKLCNNDDDHDDGKCPWGKWLSGQRQETFKEVKDRSLSRTIYATPTYTEFEVDYYQDVNLNKMDKINNSRSCFISRCFDNTYERPQEIRLVEWLLDDDDEKVETIPTSGGSLIMFCDRYCKQYVNCDNCCPAEEWDKSHVNIKETNEQKQ